MRIQRRIVFYALSSLTLALGRFEVSEILAFSLVFVSFRRRAPAFWTEIGERKR